MYIDWLRKYEMNQKIELLDDWLSLIWKDDEYFPVDKFPRVRKFSMMQEKKGGQIMQYQSLQS
jgi:hypothetical protein